MFQYFKVAVGTFLFGLIESLDDDSDTTFIAGILGIVTIKKANSLSLMTSGHPVADEVLDLCDIHKLDIIHMSELLSFDDDVRRDTFITHSFRIRLMVFASAIDLVSHL